MDPLRSSSSTVKKMPQLAAGQRMLTLVGCRVVVTTDDDATITGKLLSFDKEQNVVLGDAERHRRAKREPSKVLREHLGLTFVRGKCVVTVAYTPGVTTRSTVIDSRTDGRAAEARRLAAKRLTIGGLGGAPSAS